MSAEERALVAKEEKEKLKMMHKVSMQIDKVSQKKVPNKYVVSEAKDLEEDLDEEKIEMITKTLNRVRITQVVNKR